MRKLERIKYKTVTGKDQVYLKPVKVKKKKKERIPVPSSKKDIYPFPYKFSHREIVCELYMGFKIAGYDPRLHVRHYSGHYMDLVVYKNKIPILAVHVLQSGKKHPLERKIGISLLCIRGIMHAHEYIEKLKKGEMSLI